MQTVDSGNFRDIKIFEKRLLGDTEELPDLCGQLAILKIIEAFRKDLNTFKIVCILFAQEKYCIRIMRHRFNRDFFKTPFC